MYRNIFFLYNWLTHSLIYWTNWVYNIIMPFKTIKIKNKQTYWSTLFMINLSYWFGYTKFTYDINESTFIEFKNNKRNITTIIKPKNTIDLLDQVNKMEQNVNNKYNRFKIDNPPKIIVKSLKCGNINIANMLKIIVCGDNNISIEDLLYFLNNQNEINDEIIKMHFFDYFTEQTLEYEYTNIKHHDISFFKNLCIVSN